jgi:hypothetical protein
VIVDALLQGEQIVDVRKGGLHEEGRHFGVRSERFWLQPTYLHQQAELLKPAYRPALERVLSEAPPEGTLRIPGWAEVVGVATLTDPEELATVDGRFIWTLDYAGSRLKWKKRDPLWLLALRVHVLDEPLEVPDRPEYAGCTSWVDVHDLPDPADVASRPALTDASFEARLGTLRNDLPVPFKDSWNA